MAAGIGGMVGLALDAWPVPERYRWDVVAAAVTLVALGLFFLATPGIRTGRPRHGAGRRRRGARHH